jgi:hypothetical protein
MQLEPCITTSGRLILPSTGKRALDALARSAPRRGPTTITASTGRGTLEPRRLARVRAIER